MSHTCVSHSLCFCEHPSNNNIQRLKSWDVAVIVPGYFHLRWPNIVPLLNESSTLQGLHSTYLLNFIENEMFLAFTSPWFFVCCGIFPSFFFVYQQIFILLTSCWLVLSKQHLITYIEWGILLTTILYMITYLRRSIWISKSLSGQCLPYQKTCTLPWSLGHPGKRQFENGPRAPR